MLGMANSVKNSVEGYPRYLEPGFKPFDPLELAKQTEQIVCDGNRRKYSKFSCPRMYGGIATGYACGCCLRCIFCWVHWSRDFPEKYGDFKSPDEVFAELSRIARRKRVDLLRISGSEPTLGKSHLLGLLALVEKSPLRLFILETNGVLLGVDSEYAREIARFKKVHTRVALKAGTPEAFTRKTGAKPEFFELPFQGIRNLLSAGASCHVAAMSADSRFMTKGERKNLYERLEAIRSALLKNLEEEIVTPYPAACERLKHAGIKVDWG
ncbi:MAG: radical SAM protein [Phycisphaerales bacterium]|nr:MAG: radical SAM protein [Phycisphaerales bacterium]